MHIIYADCILHYLLTKGMAIDNAFPCNYFPFSFELNYSLWCTKCNKTIIKRKSKNLINSIKNNAHSRKNKIIAKSKWAYCT